MPVAVGTGGQLYQWRDGTTSSLAPPSDAVDIVLQNPTQWAIDNETAIVYDKVYREHPNVGGACRFMAGQMARLPLKAFIRVGDDDRIRDHKSLFARALRRPAPRRSAHQLKRDIALDLQINGNHLEEIVWANGALILQRIFWKHVRPIFNEARTAVIAWDIYDQPTAGKPRRLSNFDVLHFAMGATDSPLGVSPLEQLGVTLRIDRAAQAHQLSTLRNGAKVGVVVVIDPKHVGTEGVVETTRQEFTARYGGVVNSGKPFVASGIDVKAMPQQTLVEAELIKQRYVTREEVSAVTGLPTLFMGDMSKSTQNNFGEAYRQLFKTTLAEPMDSICSTFDAHLLDEHPNAAPPDTYCEFDINAILFGDPLERGKAYGALMGVGALTINEIRGLENRPKFDDAWADMPWLEVNNMAPADRAFAEQDAADEVAAAEGAAAD